MTEPLAGMATEITVTRPPVSHSSKSFSRYEPTRTKSSDQAFPQHRPSPQSQISAQTVESLLKNVNQSDHANDIFDAQDSDSDQGKDDHDGPSTPLPDTFDQLPIEIVSLMERFLESLTAKVHPAPLNIGQLSQLYQDFYVSVEPHIATHVAALATKLGREKSSAPSTPSIASASKTPSLTRAKSGDDVTPEHQMLTPLEIADKRRLRRQVELKRAALEEAVERGVCEKVYSRLWRHKSIDDGERDEKLRSRAAALGLVGVGLMELLSTAKGDNNGGPQAKLPERTDDPNEYIRSQLEVARTSLAQMDDEHYPVGKLKHLSTSHKQIVDFLSQIFPSSSSADEVLPTFIYAIITSHPDTLNLISNFNFIQRFRANAKITGEEAYCLTNLEAAITFLDTVDLSSLRPENKSPNQASTPRTESPNPLYRGLAGASPETTSKELKPTETPTSPTKSRRFSHLIPGARNMPLEAADSAFDAVHTALDTSFKFFFGRLKEKQETAAPFGSPDLAAPKTLEDARKLMSSPSPEEDAASLSERSLTDGNTDSASITEAQKQPDRRLLELVGGRPRGSSVDSTKSSSSSKKVAFAAASSDETKTAGSLKAVPPQPTHSPQSSIGSAAVESVKSFGSTFNPLRASWGLRGLVRPATVSTPGAENSVSSAAIAADQAKDTKDEQTPGSEGFDLRGISPPLKRFVEMKESKELNGYDIELLLRDYQRLAGALAAAGVPPPS